MERLRAGLANAVFEVDELFAANGLSSTEHPFQNATIRHCGPKTVLEMVANKVVPFDLHMTANVVYDHFTRSVRELPYRTYFNRPTVREQLTLLVCSLAQHSDVCICVSWIESRVCR